MKRAILVLTVLCSGAVFAQGFEVANPDEQPEANGNREFDERAPVQEVAAAGGDAWQPMPPPPPTEEEIQQNPMVNESPQPPAQAPTQQQFEQELSPYGKWIETPEGRVWQPDPGEVGEDFVPYSTGGTWGYNDYGWNFNTGWSWGWAPFHYGRWYRNPSYGWVWWPQYTWGASWVDWRCSRGYVGWAPLGPPFAAARFGLGVPGWSFVGRNHLWHPYVSYHQIQPRFADGRYSWYHAPAYRSVPGWQSGARSWRQPAWHQAAPWHGGGGGSVTGHAYGGSAFHSVPNYTRPSRTSGVRVGGGGGHSSGGGHRR